MEENKRLLEGEKKPLPAGASAGPKRETLAAPPPESGKKKIEVTLSSTPRQGVRLTEAASEPPPTRTLFPIWGLVTAMVLGGWAVSHWGRTILLCIPVIWLGIFITLRRARQFEEYFTWRIHRTAMRERVDRHIETADWINRIIERFWYVLEPFIAGRVMEVVNKVLEEQCPAFLDKLELAEFTLGSNPPALLGAKTHQGTDPDHIVN